MASDLLKWKEADYSLFARLLRIKESQIIRHLVTLRNRNQYFSEITHKGDLFLDPDTGIDTGHVKKEELPSGTSTYHFFPRKKIPMDTPPNLSRTHDLSTR